MVTPNSLQVKSYFSNAKIVKSLSWHCNFEIKDMEKIYFSQGSYWYEREDGTSELIWDDHYGYARIIENK